MAVLVLLHRNETFTLQAFKERQFVFQCVVKRSVGRKEHRSKGIKEPEIAISDDRKPRAVP